jgi:hypothetical protein
MSQLSCEVCQLPVNSKAKGVAQKVTGWVSPRSGGGANHIRFQKGTGEWAHVACLEEKAHPALNQASLFE